MSLSGPAVMCKVKRFLRALPVPSHYSLPNGEVSRVMQLPGKQCMWRVCDKVGFVHKS